LAFEFENNLTVGLPVAADVVKFVELIVSPIEPFVSAGYPSNELDIMAAAV